MGWGEEGAGGMGGRRVGFQLKFNHFVGCQLKFRISVGCR